MNETKDIAIGIVDDHSLFREGLCSVLEGASGINVIIKAANGQELIKQLKRKTPEVVLMDLRMPIMNGIDTTEYLRINHPMIKVLGISMYDEARFMRELIKAGGHGYLNKNTDVHELRKAIFEVREHGYYFNKNMTQAMYDGWYKTRENKLDLSGIPLSFRENQILTLICSQKNTDEMAKDLDLSPRTVEKYRQNLLEKTGVKNMAGLVMYAIVNGLVKVDIDLKV